MSRSLVATVLVSLTLVARAGSASHYDVGAVPDFEPALLAGFEQFALVDTDMVLRAFLTPTNRANFALAAGVPEARVLEVARFCELLQISGIGPRAATLLMAGGVTSVADLAARDAASLLAELENVNSVEAITSVNPSIEHVQEWIGGAQQARFLLTF